MYSRSLQASKLCLVVYFLQEMQPPAFWAAGCCLLLASNQTCRNSRTPPFYTYIQYIHAIVLPVVLRCIHLETYIDTNISTMTKYWYQQPPCNPSWTKRAQACNLATLYQTNNKHVVFVLFPNKSSPIKKFQSTKQHVAFQRGPCQCFLSVVSHFQQGKRLW